MVQRESIRKLSNFNFQWTKTLYRRIIFPFSHFSRAIEISYRKNTGKILKISCVICYFVKFDIYFGVITDN